MIHSNIKFNKGKVIYFDPFRINKNYNDSDIIFITYEHYNHFSSDDILKVMNKNTKIVVPVSIKEVIDTSKIKFKEILYVKPSIQYEIDGLKFDVIPSYNINKSFHPIDILNAIISAFNGNNIVV